MSNSITFEGYFPPSGCTEPVPGCPHRRPDLALAYAWNTSHAVSRSTPSTRSPPSSMPSSPLTNHCQCCVHHSSRKQSFAPPISMPLLVTERRTPPISPTTTSNATSQSRDVETPVLSPFEVTPIISPDIDLSPAEREALWMFPSGYEIPTRDNADQVSNDEEPEKKKSQRHKIKTKVKQRLRGLVSNSKENIRHLWKLGEEPDPWRFSRYT